MPRIVAVLLCVASCAGLLAGCTSSSVAAAPPAAPAGPAPRPHILFVLADDLGWADAGFQGSDLATPHIDRIAAEGARFEQLYTQPFCTPTRAALMTGRYPFRYGLQTAVIPSTGTYGLAEDEVLLPQALKDAGYATAIVGKWHLGHASRAMWPNHRGFDTRYGMNIGEIDYFGHDAHGVTDWFRGDEQVVEEGYSTTLLGDEAVRVVTAHDPATPLFLYLAFNAPHAPFQAPQAYLDRFPGITDPTRKAYAGMVASMDDEIGRVLDALAAKGMLDDTLVVFQSDNGAATNAMFTGELDMSGLALPCSNGPYRDGKGSTYEGGTRVVACARWAGRIPAGSVVEGPMHVVDWFPTLVGLAGGAAQPGKPLDGLDMRAVLTQGAPSPRSEVVYNVESFGAAVRQGDWKLVWKTTLPSRTELFDIAADPYEQHDVAAAHPDVVARLRARADALAAEGMPAILLKEALGVAKPELFGAPAFPAHEE